MVGIIFRSSRGTPDPQGQNQLAILSNRRCRNRVCLELVINGLWIWRQGANTAEFLPPGIQFVGAGYTADTDSQGAYLLQHIS